MVEGTKKASGEQDDEPISVKEGLISMSGFKSAGQAREYEAGGKGAAKKEIRKERQARTSLMAKWRGKDQAERREFFQTEIREWNSTHKGDERIDYSDLMRSVRSAKQRQKELEEEMAE
jgi:hypothetical protein